MAEKHRGAAVISWCCRNRNAIVSLMAKHSEKFARCRWLDDTEEEMREALGVRGSGEGWK